MDREDLRPQRHRRRPAARRRARTAVLERLEGRTLLSTAAAWQRRHAAALAARPRPVPAAAVVQVPGRPGEAIATTFTLEARRASYRSEVGLFLVDGPDGRVGDLHPGDRGYAAAALGRRIALFERGQEAGAVARLALPGGASFGTYLIQDSTAARLLARNPGNRPGRRPVAFFSPAAANPDRFAHVRQPAADVLAFEDLWRGGDRDFDDAVVRIAFAPPPTPTPEPADTTPPVVALRTPTPGELDNRDVVAAGRVADDRSGVARLQARWTAGDPIPNDGWSDVAFDPSTGDFRFPAGLAVDGSADGPHTLLARATDRAGNTSAPVAVSFTLDTRGPAVTVESTTPASPSTIAPTIAGRVADDLSGVATLRAQVDGGPAVAVALDPSGHFAFATPSTADGPHTVRFVATDRAGNDSAPALAPFTVDATPPTLSAGPAAPDPTNGGVVVTGTAADALSGLAAVTARLDDGPAATLAVDAGGQFRYDPDLTAAGIVDGPHIIHLRATDRAGNPSPIVDRTFTLDRVAPTATLISPADGLATNQPVTAAGAVADDRTGVARLDLWLGDDPSKARNIPFADGQFAAPLGLTADGDYTVHVRATDRADNESAVVSRRFTYDTMPPTVTITSPAPGQTTPVNPTLVGTVADALSGVAKLTAQVDNDPEVPVAFDASGGFTFTPALALDGSADGKHTIHLVAVDRATNTSRPDFFFTLDTSMAAQPCDFAGGLAGWDVAQRGGTEPGQGDVTVAGTVAVLREGDSFEVGLSRSFLVPTVPSSLSVTFDDPAFDTAAAGLIKDAFEIALLDAAGRPLVHTIGAGRDAFFNLTEGLPAALGAEATLADHTVTLDLSGIAAGTTATLVLRLVNNDGDTGTIARVACVMLPMGAAPVAPGNGAGLAATASATQELPLLVSPSMSPGLGAPAATADDQAAAFAYEGAAPLVGVGQVPGTDTITVEVGYADNLRPSPFYPTPWNGAPMTVFVGTTSSHIDGGAIRIINNGRSPITVDDVVVTLPGGQRFDLWGSSVVPAGWNLILTQTASTENFDTSDYGTLSFPQTYPDGETAHAAHIDITVNGVPLPTFLDTGHVLTTGGSDLAAGGANESLNWRPIATTGVGNPAGDLPYAVRVDASASPMGGPPGTTTLIAGHAESVREDHLAMRPIAAVTINGVPADALDAAGNFFASVPTAPGRTTYDIVATDAQGTAGHTTLILDGVDSPAGPVDFALFSDVSASFRAEYGRTSLNADAGVLFADWAVRNTGGYPADAPLVVAVRNITEPSVRVVGADGLTPDGLPYFDFTPRIAGPTLAPDGRTGSLTLTFADPGHVPFGYELVFLAKLNHAPAITSIPAVEALAGKPYTYAASAMDADDDPMRYSLRTGPSRMVVDAATGRVSWAPSASDLGNHDVVLRVEDGRGGWAEQRYTVTAIVPPPNRPPVFTSVPVVSAIVADSAQVVALPLDTLSRGGRLSDQFAAKGVTFTNAGDTNLSGLATGTVVDTGRQDLGIGPIAGSSGPGVAISPDPTTVGLDFDDLPDDTPLGDSYSSAGITFENASTRTNSTNAVSGSNAIWSTDQLTPLVIRFPRGAIRVGIQIDRDGYNLDRQPQIRAYDAAGALIGSKLFGQGPDYEELEFNDRLIYEIRLGSSPYGVPDGPLFASDSYDNLVCDIPSSDYTATFRDPATGAPTTTDFVSLLVGNGDPAADRVEFSFFDSSGNLLGRRELGSPGGPNDPGIRVTEFTPGIGSVKVRGLGGRRAVALADFRFGRSQSGFAYLYPSQARDPDGDTLTYSLVNGPAGMVVDPGSGLVAWDPDDRQVGTHAVIIRADDGRGGLATQSYTVLVQQAAGNHAPAIISAPVTTAVVGQPYAYDVRAIDPDGDPLTYALATAPAGMTIDRATGRIVWSPTLAASTTSYPDFRSTDGLGLNGTARRDGAALSLTQGGTFQAASAWLLAPQVVQYGFDTTFDFRIAGAADGIAFVVQGAGPDALGGNGGHLGYANYYDTSPGTGIADSLAVEFDVLRNGDDPVEAAYPSDSHLSVHTRGTAENSRFEQYSLGHYAAGGFVLNDGQVHRARIAYDGKTLSIYLDDMDHARLGVAVALPSLLLLDQGRAYVGFTAGSGSSTARQEVLDWSFTQYAPGPAGVTVHVDDGRGGSDEQSFTIDVVGNRPPTIVSSPVTVASGGRPYSYDVVANDPDDDPLTYSLANAPAGMAIDPNSGRITWEVPAERSGPAAVITLGASGETNPPYETAHAVATDARGYVYVVGSLRGTVDFDPGPGVVLATGSAYVAKYAPDGSLAWARTFDRAADAPPGSRAEVSPYGVAVDPAGNVLVSGACLGRTDLDPGPGSTPFDAAGGGAFVVKLDPDGGFLWGRGINSASAGYGNSVGADGLGNVFLSGTFNNGYGSPPLSDLDPGPGVYTVDTGGAVASFVEKLTPDGDFAWAFTSGSRYAPGVTADADGNAYALFSGWTLRKLSSAGQSLWESALHLNGAAEAVALDRTGDVYVTGYSSGEGWIDTPTGRIDLSTTKSAAVVAKFGPDGQPIWARQPTGAGASEALGVAVGLDSRVVVGGRLWSGALDFDAGPGTQMLDSGPDYNGFAWVLDPDGHYVWAGSVVPTDPGPLAGVSPNDVAVDPAGRILLAGYFSGTADFDPGPGSLSRTAGGDTDGFLAWLTPPPSRFDVTVRVEDGRGGSDEQSFTIDVSTAAPGVIRGSVFDDLDGDGLRGPGDVLVASIGTDQILRYDGRTGAFLGAFAEGGGLHAPEGLIVGPDCNLYVESTAADGTGSVLRYDGRTGEFLGVFAAGGGLLSPHGLAFGPDGNLYVGNRNLRPGQQPSHGSVLRYDGRTGAFLGVFAEGGKLDVPLAMATGPDGYLYVTSQLSHSVLRYDVTTGALHDVFVTPGSGGLGQPHDFAFGPDGNLYVASVGGSGGIIRYDGRTGAFLGSFIPAGRGGLNTPTSLAFGDDGFVYVNSYSTNSVLRFDATTGAFAGVFAPSGSGGLSAPDFMTLVPTEPGLPGWVVYLDQNDNGTRDPGERWTTTDPCGNYTFAGLAPGTYTVAEELQPGWAQTVPSTRIHTITIDTGQVVTGIDFGNKQSTGPIEDRPPAFRSTPVDTATLGRRYRYDARATDPDGDPLTYDLVLAPAGMAVEPSTGIVVWTPTADQVGVRDVQLRVRDGRGGVDLQSFRVRVVRENSTPVITSNPRGPAVVGHPYLYQVTAQDADGDPITFSLGAHPDGMAIDPATGRLTWTPAAGQAGSPHVEVNAADSHGAATTQIFDLPTVVAAADRPPAIGSSPRLSTRLGRAYLYAFQASDPDGDPLTITLPVHPAGMTIDAAGLISWTPTADQLGSNPVTIVVDDGRGLTATQSFTVDVLTSSTNHAPGITSSPPQSATVGTPYAYDLAGSDPDGDPLAWSLDSAPAGMSIDPARGTIRWTPSTDQLGRRDVAIRVDDGQGGFATQSFAIDVRAVNHPPAIRSNPPTTAAVGHAYSYAVRADDPDGDRLTFSLDAAPSGMTIDPSSGLIAWTPAAGQVGRRDVTVRVIDGRGGSATQPYTVVVADAAPNRYPVITSTAPQTAQVGTTYTYHVTASDPDGDPLYFLLLAMPAGMTIAPDSGLVTWTPTADQLGLRPVVVAAADPDGAAGTQSFNIVVLDDDRPPTIDSKAPQVVTAGLPYRYDVRASDPDGDPLTYQLDVAPAGMTIDRLGRVAWSPGIADIGTHRVAITVDDGRLYTTTQSYDLVVLADGQTPRIGLSITPDSLVAVGTAVTFVVTATDNVGVTALGLKVGGVAVPLDAAGRATITRPIGQYAVVASASDAAGNTGLATTTLQVLAPPSDPPHVEMSAPTDGAVIRAAVDVTGTVADDNLLYYTLAVAPVGSDDFTEILRKPTTGATGVLGRFDPSGLANDSYILRLSATDASGNTSYVDTTVGVAGDLKLGNFTLSFTDLTIPVSGIPITVTRTYDSLNAGASDDFGFGWRLEFRDTDLRTSVPRTTADEQGLGIFNAFRDGSRVYVTMPGGRREGFTFRPTRKAGFGGLFNFWDPAFVADPGVTDRLAVRGTTLVQNEFGEFYGLLNGGSLPFNPEDALNFGGVYSLTTTDGLAYEIDARTGDLNAVADTDGNVLTFSDAGIDSNRGVRVSFDRDPQDRIVAVHDPMGEQVHYRYNLAGDLVAVTDREGNTTTFEYDAPNRPHYLTRVADPLGRTGVRTEYDDNGRLVRLIDADGKAVQLAYDPDHSLETVRDLLGNPTTYEYDERGNVVREVDALDQETVRTYDPANNLTAETDPLLRTTRYTYDANGNVLTVTDPSGQITRNTYTTFTPGFFGRLTFGSRPVTLLASTTDPLGNTTRYTYAVDSGLTGLGAARLLSTTDAEGHVTRYTYDGAGNQTSIIVAPDNTTSFEYDGRGNLRRQVDALGHATTYTYDANGNPLTQATTLTTPAGVRTLVTTTAYDAGGHPTSVTDAEGHTTFTEYDKLGRQVRAIDARGNATGFAYDDRGQLVETDFADGTRTTTEYDAAGRRTATADRAGRVTHFTYDALGRLIATIYPDATPADLADNPRTKTEYDAAGQVIAQVDERDNRTVFKYDSAGRQILVRDAAGNEIATDYDAAGRRSSVTDARKHTTRFYYDDLGRLTTTTFADGTTTSTTYDALGRATAQTDQLDRTTRFEYDKLGRLTAVVDALPQRTEYEYDEAGDLVVQRDANSHETHYEYDGLGRRTATVLPLGQRSTMSFDAAGNVQSTTDFNGATITYTYDKVNRLTARAYPDGTSVAFTYTPTGQRETVTDARGVTTYAYDPRDRLLSRTDPDGRQISYTYDLAGNRTSVSIPSGTTAYTFDKLNRLATVTDPAGGQTRYSYDADSNLVRTDLPNGTAEIRQYDLLNHLTYLENDGPAGVISSYRYTLASTGRRDAVVEDSGRRVDYRYDALDRLIDELITDPAAGNRTIRYTYDPVGNRLTRADSAEGTTTYAYDADDRLLTETLGAQVTQYGYDANRNTTSKVTSAVDQALYEWDADNRLIGAQVTDAQGTHHLGYRYDADGIRVASTVDGTETRYLIDSNQPYAQVLEEYTPGGVIQVSYVYGNDLISQDRGGSKSYYHVDGLGSTRALTNASGIVTDRYVYDAFGRTIGQVGTTGNVYLFAGEQRDANLGLDYLRARYLAVGTGRFYGMDPFEGLTSSPSTLHPYLYTLDNPVNLADPSGEFVSAIFDALLSLQREVISLGRALKTQVRSVSARIDRWRIESTVRSVWSQRREASCQFACNQFVQAVVQELGYKLPGVLNADGIINHLQGSTAWEKLGRSPELATSRANGGYLVVGGLRSDEYSPPRSHGHVVIVSADRPERPPWPQAWWETLGGSGSGPASMRLTKTFTQAALPLVRYFAYKL